MAFIKAKTALSAAAIMLAAFTGATVAAGGSHTLTVYYVLTGSRSFSLSINGGPDIVLNLTGSSWSTPVTTALTVTLNAGTNTLKFHNDAAYAPDLDRIVVR